MSHHGGQAVIMFKAYRKLPQPGSLPGSAWPSLCQDRSCLVLARYLTLQGADRFCLHLATIKLGFAFAHMDVQAQHFEIALLLVLQHVELPPCSVCQLLCVSSTTAGLVHAGCAGKYPVTFSGQTLQDSRFISWLSKHAVLVYGVEHTSCAGPEDAAWEEEASKQLAAALTTAGAQPAGLMLQYLKTCSLSVTSACLELPTPYLSGFEPLQQFPISKRTGGHSMHHRYGRTPRASDLLAAAVVPVSCLVNLLSGHATC